MQLERCTKLRVPLSLQGRQADGAGVAALLSDPQLVLRQLLSGEQLEQQGAGVFLYTPRPLELPGIRLAPLVHFRAEWKAPLLAISLVNYQLPGLESLERKVKYHFRAELQQTDGDLLVRAGATVITSPPHGTRRWISRQPRSTASARRMATARSMAALTAGRPPGGSTMPKAKCIAFSI